MNAVFFERLKRVVFSHAVIISVLLYVLAVFLFDLYLVLADNMFFSSVLNRWNEITVVGGGNMIYVSYLLACAFSAVSGFVPRVDLYTLYIHLCNLAILSCFSYSVVQTNERPGISHWVGWLLIGLYVCIYALNCEYTVISFAAMTSGLVMISTNVRNAGCSWWVLGVGVAVFAMGCLLRYDSCVGILPFVCIMVWIAYRLRNAASFASYILCGFCVVLCYLLQAPLSSTDYGNIHVDNLTAMNVNRMKFCDYADDSGLDKTALYQEAGCSDNELQLYSGCIFQHNKCFHEDYWERLGGIRDMGRPTFSFSRAYQLLKNEYYVKVLSLPPLAILLLLLFCRNSVRVQYGDYFLLASALCFVLLLMKGRINPVSSLAVMQPCLGLWVAHMPSKLSFRLSRWIMGLLAVCGVLWILREMPYSRLTVPSIGGRWAEPTATRLVEAECGQHEDYTYFAEAHLWRRIALPYSSVQAADLKHSMNFYPYTGWQVFFPSYQSSLRRRGLGSPSELLLSDKVRFILRLYNVKEHDHTEPLPEWLKVNFKCIEDDHHVKLKLVVEKNLGSNLYVARVVRESP